MKQKKIVGSRKSKKLLRISQYSVEPQQTKEALRRSEEQYRMLVEQASDGIFVADSHNYVIDVNTSGCLMLGYTRQELVGRHITELIAQKDILAMTEIIDQIRNGKTVVREIGFFRKNGVFFLAEISMKMFPDGRWQGIARDITERRRTEEALKESEVRYRGVVEDQVDLIRRFQPDGTLILVNGAFCRCFGKTTEELLGQNVLTLILPEDRELFRQQISSLTPDCPVAVVERRFIRPDGEVRWQQWVNRAIFGEGSQIVEFQSVGRDITVQKQVEQQLKESEARYRGVVEDQVELIRRFLPDGTLTFVNGAFCRYFDKTMEELLGQSIMTLIPAEDHKAVQDQIFSLSADNPVAVAERRFIKPDGEARWQQWVNRAIINEDGEIVEFQSVGRDITLQKQVEQQLKESEARYRGVVEDQVELIRRFLPDGTLTFVNGAFCRYFDKTMEELLGQSIMTLIPAEDHKAVQDQIFSLSADNPVAVAERRFIKPDGEARWQQWVNRAIINEDGEIVEFQSVGRDITLQKQVEQQLKESEARYRGVVEDQVELIRRFLPDGTLTFVNGAFCRYFDKTMEELLGQSIMTLIPEEDHEALEAQIFSLSIENPVALSERRFLRPDGEVRWQQWVNRAIFDEEGQIREFQSVGRDITAQKEAELSITEARAATARAARVATLAVIGGGIAHEINQPLNAIRVLAETVLYLYESKGLTATADVIKNVKNISRQVDRIDSIVNHLRSFLRSSQNFDYLPCELNDVVEKSLSLVNHQLFSKHIRIKNEMELDLPPVYGCFIRFEEVVLNLLMNAMQALDNIDKKNKEIVIRTWADDKVHISVSDNGCGIDPAMRGKIFEPFFTTKSGDSMGLGLSIVHSIVVSSNGSITINDNSQGGATVQVSFPICSN